MAECTQWTRRWRFWHCCGVDAADYQCSAVRPPGNGWLSHHLLQANHFTAKCLQFKQEIQAIMAPIGRYMMAYRGGQCNRRSSFSSISFLSLHLQCRLHCFTNLTTFCQEQWHHSNIQQNNFYDYNN
jgi:hypothetical protein